MLARPGGSVAKQLVRSAVWTGWRPLPASDSWNGALCVPVHSQSLLRGKVFKNGAHVTKSCFQSCAQKHGILTPVVHHGLLHPFHSVCGV